MREKLIELLKKTQIAEINGHIAEAEACFVSHVFESMADHLIANGVRLETKQATSDKASEKNKRWIPVTERLPYDPTERVLVKVKAGNVLGSPDIDTDRFDHNEIGGWLRWGYAVTHWMPLPEPPKED